MNTHAFSKNATRIIITPFYPEFFYYTVKNKNNADCHFLSNYSERFVTNMWTFTRPLLVGML